MCFFLLFFLGEWNCQSGEEEGKKQRKTKTLTQGTRSIHLSVRPSNHRLRNSFFFREEINCVSSSLFLATINKAPTDIKSFSPFPAASSLPVSLPALLSSLTPFPGKKKEEMWEGGGPVSPANP